MGLYGNIKTMALSDILSWVGMGNKEGTLTLNSENETKTIYYKDGNLIYALSSLSSEQLSGLLVKHNVVSRETSVTLHSEGYLTDREYALALLDNGYATMEQIGKISSMMVEDVFYSLFAWKSGVFLLLDTPVPMKDILPAKIGLTNMIMEGTRRADELIRTKEEMARYRSAVFKVSREKKKQFQAKLASLGPTAVNVWSVVKGNRTLDDVVKLSPENELVTLDILQQLMQEKFIVPKKANEEGVSTDERLADLVSRGETYLAQGRLGDAIHSWSEVVTISPDHPIKERYDETHKTYVEGLKQRLGPPTRIPAVQMEVSNVDPQDLLIPEECMTLFLAIDGDSNLNYLARELGIPLEEVYTSLNRLVEMAYVRLEGK